MGQPPILQVHQGGAGRAHDSDPERLHRARLAIVRGYEEAVRELSPGDGRVEHAEFFWYRARLSEARRLAGLPPVTLLQAQL